MSSLAPLTVSLAASAGPSVVDEAHAPASIRSGSASVKQAYASAQGFEEMLLQQLSSSLVQSSGLSGEGESSSEEGSPEGGGEAGSSLLSSLLPQTLTEGVLREGGLGLAGQLMHSLDPSASATSAPTGARLTGGASAPAGAPSAPAPAAATNGAVAAPPPSAAANGAAAQTGGASV
jgi:Rod binding domain-containing protein